MATSPKGSDPRVKRTRQLLQRAFLELLQERGFAAISIQDIAERATVNRGTFYAHFADKSLLLDSIIREEFQRVLASKLPSTATWGRTSLRLLIEAVLEFFRQVNGHCSPADAMNPLIERAAQEEICRQLEAWLKEAPTARARLPVPVATIALVVSWGIFGAAVQWSQGTASASAERTANDVLLVVAEGLAHLAPGALPE